MNPACKRPWLLFLVTVRTRSGPVYRIRAAYNAADLMLTEMLLWPVGLPISLRCLRGAEVAP